MKNAPILQPRVRQDIQARIETLVGIPPCANVSDKIAVSSARKSERENLWSGEVLGIVNCGVEIHAAIRLEVLTLPRSRRPRTGALRD
jgi:hypothetical protein